MFLTTADENLSLPLLLEYRNEGMAKCDNYKKVDTNFGMTSG